MPYRINGIGTGYFGHRNRIEQQGQCTGCGYHGILKSYETFEFFSILFIPLIPLGKRRVMNFCPNCSRHLSFTEEKFKKMLSDAREKFDIALRDTPEDIDAIGGAVFPFFEFEDHDGLSHVARSIGNLSSPVPEIARLAGDAHRLMGNWEEARRVYHQLGEKFDDDPTFREVESLTLMAMGRLDEARGLLSHVYERAEADKVWLLNALALEYRLRGDHGRALELFDQMEAVFPEARNDREFMESRKDSQKKIHSNKPSGQGFEMLHPKKGGASWSLSTKLAFSIVPLILLAIVASYVVAAFSMGGSRNVWLVNGLTSPYEVSINGGGPVVLAPGRPTPIKVREGAIVIHPANDAPIDPVTVTVSTSVFTRPFTSDHSFVINPDLCALVEFSEVIYTPENSPNTTRDADYRINTGVPLYSFGAIDYPFVEPPETIKLPSRASSSVKKALRVIPPSISWLSNVEARPIRFLANPDSTRGDVVAMLRARLRHEPEFPDSVHLAYFILDEDDFIQSIHPVLLLRPVRTETHRAYQTMLRVDEHESLVNQYREWVAAEPQDSSLVYLLSRVVPDEEERLELLEQAAALPNPDPYVWQSIAFSKLANGDFASAALYADRAREEGVMSLDGQRLWRDTMLASGNWEALHADYSQEAYRDTSMELLIDYLGAMTQFEGRDMAMAELNRLEGNITRLFGQQSRGEVVSLLQQVIDEVSNPGSVAPFRLEADSYDYVAATLLHEGLDAALDAAHDTGTTQLDSALLFVALHRAGLHDEAQTHLQEYIEQIEYLFRPGGPVHSVLTRQPGSDPMSLLTVSGRPSEKRIMLLVASELYPNHRQPLLELLGRLNYDHSFPYWLIEAYRQQ